MIRAPLLNYKIVGTSACLRHGLDLPLPSLFLFIGLEDYVDLASTFSLSNLLPRMDLLSKYYRYKGSLTTPGCEEVVTWTIFEEQIPISRTQVGIVLSVLAFQEGRAPPW